MPTLIENGPNCSFIEFIRLKKVPKVTEKLAIPSTSSSIHSIITTVLKVPTCYTYPTWGIEMLSWNSVISHSPSSCLCLWTSLIVRYPWLGISFFAISFSEEQPTSCSPSIDWAWLLRLLAPGTLLTQLVYLPPSASENAIWGRLLWIYEQRFGITDVSKKGKSRQMT